MKAARTDVLKARGRGAGVRAVKAELEGHGVLAKVLEALSNHAQKTAEGGGAGISFATAGPKSPPSGLLKLGGRAAKDLVNAPAAVVPSVYVPAAGVVEAAKGHPERIKKFASDLNRHDPVVNLGAAALDAAKGDTRSAKKRLEQAKDAANEHPGFTALEVLGVKGAIGRGTTRVATRVGGKAAKAVSTERAPRVVPGTSLREERHYSPDAITKGATVAVEKTRTRVARRMRAHADRVEQANPGMAESFRKGAAHVDPVKGMTEAEIQKRVDEHVDANEAVRRAHRGEVVNETRKLVKPAEKAGPVANLVAQGITHADVKDLRDYVAELEKEYPGLSNAAKRSNKTLRRGIEKAIGHAEKGDVDLPALEALVAKYRKGQSGREKALADREMLPDEQAMKAAAIPYAVRRMGARHDKEKGLVHEGDVPMIEHVTVPHDVKEVEPLDTATRKAIARRSRKGATRPAPRVNVTADDAFSTRALPVEKTGGTPHLPADKAEWFHGTPLKYEGLPTAKGQWSDLGVYLTSDPRYARGYAGAAGVPRGEVGHVLPVRVQPKKVLDWRAGKENPAELKRVVDTMLAKDRESYPRGNVGTEMLEGWSRVLGEGKRLTPETSRNLQDLLQEVSESVGERTGRKGTGNRHQVLADTLRHLGYDAVRKVDLHADALVVLNEGIMRRVRGTEGTPTRRVATRHTTRVEPRVRMEKGDVRLPLADIHAHMLAHGEPIPSFLSQAPNARGARNFFQSSSRAPHIDQARRTGEATRGGTFDAHPDTLVEQAARQQGLVDAFDGFHGFLNEFAIKGLGGKIKTLKTRKQVEQAARDAMFDEHGEPRAGAIKFVPVRVNPFGGRHEQLAKMLEGTDSAAQHGAQAINDAIHSALNGDGDGDWALVPEAAAKRLQEHVRVLNPGNLGKVGQKVNTVFRKTVLATSLPWLAGNTIEGGMRAALAHAGPRSYRTGRRVLARAKELDKQKGEAFAARTVGGGHFGSAERQHVHLNVDAMNPGKVKALSKGLGAFWRSPGPKQAANLWHNYTHTVFNVVNRAAETQIQTAMLGKALRDSHLMTPELLRLSEKAVDEAARGALDVNTAADLGRQVDIMYGKYGKWSPDMRKMVALYTPFVAWTLNAAYFVLRTLPRDHPVATGLLAATLNATDEWRKEHGLDKFIQGAVPDWLQGSIPLPGGGHLRAPFRYTPFGAWSNIGETIGGNVLPLYSSPIAALAGRDWTGKPLRDSNGDPLHEPFTELAAGRAFVEATVPGLSLGERFAKGGPKAVLDSALGKVAPSTRKASRSRSSSKPGFVGGSGSSGGFVKPGGSGGGFVR